MLPCRTVVSPYWVSTGMQQQPPYKPNGATPQHDGAARRWLLRRWECVPSLNVFSSAALLCAFLDDAFVRAATAVLRLKTLSTLPPSSLPSQAEIATQRLHGDSRLPRLLTADLVKHEDVCVGLVLCGGGRVEGYGSTLCCVPGRLTA